MKKLLVGLFLVITNTVYAYKTLPTYPVDTIYGRDNRSEVDEYYDEKFIEKSNSVALRVNKKRLTVYKFDNNRILFDNNKTLESSQASICSDERFVKQVSLGTCSGFLVGPSTLVTAGHCIADINDCSKYQWVFGYKEGVTELTKSQVYTCKSLTDQKFIKNKNEFYDYAIIELDRKVRGYVPLKLRKNGNAALNTPLVIIGHPMGLPMKIADDGLVTPMNGKEPVDIWKFLNFKSNYFTTNLDTFDGNSGSPVFNQKNGQVEGILIAGEDDLVYNEKKDCLESVRVGNYYFNAKEVVMKITKIPGLKKY